eukprot:1171928-Amphidinium_carterae.1
MVNRSTAIARTTCTTEQAQLTHETDAKNRALTKLTVTLRLCCQMLVASRATSNLHCPDGSCSLSLHPIPVAQKHQQPNVSKFQTAWLSCQKRSKLMFLQLSRREAYVSTVFVQFALSSHSELYSTGLDTLCIQTCSVDEASGTIVSIASLAFQAGCPSR